MKNKTKTKTKAAELPKVKGVTELTVAKHKYAGFSVRAQRNGYHCQRYVSASLSKRENEKTEEAARVSAYHEAVSLRKALGEVLDDKKSWKDGKLTQKTTRLLTSEGYKIQEMA